ncbi:MAG: TIGR01777 family oxidoreductase [Methylococcales bacterium]
MNIFITGGTGFIGRALTQHLRQQGHAITILSRHPETIPGICGADIKAISDLQNLPPEIPYQIIINLAGAPIFDARWTESRKQLIRSSRIGLTEQLVAAIARMPVKPELLISGSAIGYYGDQGDTVLTEQATTRQDFSQQLCSDWETAARQAEVLGVRVCLIRTGLVIGANGGLLKRMLLPFQLGLGGRLGSGQQWMSWIDRQDWIAICDTMINDASMRGAYNATAPNPVSNAEFTQTLAQCLNRPALLPLPGFFLKMLIGEMSELVLGSQRVIPDRLLTQGFTFQYPSLASAINHALKG